MLDLGHRILDIEVSLHYFIISPNYTKYCFLIFFNNILGSSTLPRATTRATETEVMRGDKVTAATSSTSLYDNVGSTGQSTNNTIHSTQGEGTTRDIQTAGSKCNCYFTSDSSDTLVRQTKSQETSTMTNAATITTTSVGTQNHVGSQVIFCELKIKEY